MKLRLLIMILIAILFTIGACSLSSGVGPATSQNATSQVGSNQPAAVTQPPPSSGNGQAGSQTDVQKSFPLAPDSHIVSPDYSEPDDHSGGFTINSQSATDEVVRFYTTELPKQGWTFRYTDSNYTCGVTQYWKKDNIFLRLDFIYEETGLSIKAQYTRVDPQAIHKLPEGFPLPATAELIDASDISWNFYILQDYLAVYEFYVQKLAALKWQPGIPPGSVEASCGDDSGCSGNGNKICPAGAIPMPTPTIDSRQTKYLVYTMPDGNEINLTIRSHQDATILQVDLTLNSVGSAGLPKDVPIYPGAVVGLILPGIATFEVHADLTTIKNFYEEQLKAAGWTPDGNAVEVSGTYLQNWKKDGQSLSISVSSSGQNVNTLVITCTNCVP